MSDEIFDCAIAGGGVAGLTLGIQLAGAGYRVILFEKEKYPYHKVCGEYVSMESYDFLQRIGFPFSEFELPSITEVRVSAPDGSAFTHRLDLGGFGISRFTLDATLARMAVNKGVTLLEETRVEDVTFQDGIFRIKAAANDYFARTMCCAYGKRSGLDKKLHRDNREKKNYIGVKYHVKLDFPENRIELHNFKDGYCGISKIDGEKYCMCYSTTAHNLRESGSIPALEKTILSKNPFLRRYFSAAEFLYDAPVTISQITFSKKTAVENNMLMLGDAAGNIAPLCGNGMSMAMHASFIASTLVKRYLNGEISLEQMLKQYENKWNALFSSRIASGRRLQYLFGKEIVTRSAITMLNHFPAITRHLIKMTHGQKF